MFNTSVKHRVKMWRDVILLLLCGIAVVHGDKSYDEKEHFSTKMCSAHVSKDNSVSCDYSTSRIELKTDSSKHKACILNVTQKSLNNFQRKYKHLKFNFAKLLLKFTKGGKTVPVSYTKCVLQPLSWVWTHTGKDTAFKSLFWPRDFSILSLGTLERRVYGPYCVFIKMRGNCSSFVIGHMNTTIAIVRALSALIPKPKTTQLAPIGVAEDSNMWCYTKRINTTDTMRFLCRYMICPYETVGYSCCRQNSFTKSLKCNGQPYRYSKVWWEFPYIVGSFLFLFCPLIFIAVAEILHMVLRDPKPMNFAPNEQEQEWISENHVCFSSVLFSPFRGVVVRNPVAMSRVVRIFVSFMTLSLTILHLIVVWKNYSLRLFLIELAKNHVATDIASMIAGFKLSRENFLTIFGGPYIAFSMFGLLFATMLSIPKSLPILLESGLPDPPPGKLSPLSINMDTKSEFGAVHSLHTSIGYRKIYRTLIAQLVMLLNPKFWKFVLKHQTERWTKFSVSACNGHRFAVYVISFPVYVVICVLESFVCLLYYGLPVVFFNVLVYRAYYLKIRHFFRNTPGRIAKSFIFPLVCLIVVILVYCSYILHILFVHSFIFLARAAVFTYTGFIAYPEHYRNYLICYLSVAIYVVESIRSMKLTYDELFDNTKLVCDVLMDDEKYEDSNITKKVDSTVLIPQNLFNFVISRHKPLRIETFLMLYKLLLTIMVLYMSVLMLVMFDTFDHMNLLTEVGTTVVICMAPKVLRRVFKCSGYKNEVEERRIIKLWILDYLDELTTHQRSLSRDRSVSFYVL